MSESPPKPDSTFSERTDDSVRSDAIMALGRKLVEELGLEPSVDTLGRWMAHYIADLIVKAEGLPGGERGLAEKECFDAIITLWKHRAELPNGKRPFEELEPVIRAIESLDPEDDTPRYYRSALAPKADGGEGSEAYKWLGIASALDNSAKILIGYCLGEAAQAAVDKSKEWVRLAEAAGAKDDALESVVRFFSGNTSIGEEPDPDAEMRRQLQSQIERLGGFIEMAEAVVRDLKGRLNAFSPPAENDDGDPNDHIVISLRSPVTSLASGTSRAR